MTREKKRSYSGSESSDSEDSADSTWYPPAATVHSHKSDGGIIDLVNDDCNLAEDKKPSARKPPQKKKPPTKKTKPMRPKDSAHESTLENTSKKPPPKNTSIAVTSIAKKVSKANPPKKSKLTMKSPKSTNEYSSDEYSIANKKTPLKTTPTGKPSTASKPRQALMDLTPVEHFAIFTVQSGVKPNIAFLRRLCTDQDFKRKVASEDNEVVRVFGENLFRQIELLNNSSGFSEDVCAAMKKDHEKTLKAIVNEMTQLIADQEALIKNSKGDHLDQGGTEQDWAGWHYNASPHQHFRRIPAFHSALFEGDERKKMAPLTKIKAFQKQASKNIFSGANMFWKLDGTYEPVSTRAQEEKLERFMVRFENLDTKTKRNKSQDVIVYPFDRKCDYGEDSSIEGFKQVNDNFYDFHKKSFLFRTMCRPKFRACLVDTPHLDFLCVRDYMAITVNCVQSDPETTNMPYAIISFIKPPANKLKAFPTCAKHPTGCGRSTKIGDVVRIDGYETISVNNWLLCVAAKKIVPSAANSKDSVDLGCTLGYVKVIYSQYHLVVNRVAQVSEIIEDTFPNSNTSNMGKGALVCAKAIFLDGTTRETWA